VDEQLGEARGVGEGRVRVVEQDEPVAAVRQQDLDGGERGEDPGVLDPEQAVLVGPHLPAHGVPAGHARRRSVGQGEERRIEHALPVRARAGRVQEEFPAVGDRVLARGDRRLR